MANDMIDVAEGNYRDFDWLVMEHPSYGHLCGYVRMPQGHPWFEADYKDLGDVECHGGLTFSGEILRHPGHWIGFDCAHAGDFIPRFSLGDRIRDEKRDAGFVLTNCQTVIDQAVAAANGT